MALKIRLRQQGRTNRVCYRLVVTDSCKRRDGSYLEALGWYDPHIAEDDKNLCIKADRVLFWLERGALLTEKAKALVARSAPEVIQRDKERELRKKARLRVKEKERRQSRKG